MKTNVAISGNVPTLVDGGVCGLVDSATSYKRVLVAGRIIENEILLK